MFSPKDWLSKLSFGEDSWEAVKDKINKENIKELFQKSKDLALSPGGAATLSAGVHFIFPGAAPFTLLVSTGSSLYHVAGARKEYDEEVKQEALREIHTLMATALGAWAGSLLRLGAFRKIFLPAIVIALVIAYLQETAWNSDQVMEEYGEFEDA